MAIFSRRTIQQLLNESYSYLSEKQVESHMGRLNAGGRDALSAEWEVVLLNAFSKVGQLSHEGDVPGSTRPDIVFFGHTNRLETLFIADIAAVSDDSHHKDNPIDYFLQEMRRVARRLGMTLAGFDLEIGASSEGSYRDAKVILRLPKKGDITAVIEAHFTPFLRTVRHAPSKANEISVQIDSFDFTIRYNPNEKSTFSAHFQDYRSVYSLDRNVIVNCLRDKASQLRKAEFEGIKGVILCDADCAVLQHGSTSGGASYQLRDLVGNAFKRLGHLSFVLTLTLRRESGWLSRTKPIIDSFLYKNPGAKHPLDDRCIAVLEAAIPQLPTAREFPINASRRLDSKHANIGVSFAGGFQMSGNQIKIPARSLLEILAGISGPGAEPPADIFSSTLDPQCTQFVLRKLQEGRLIARIYLEPCPEEDDDWVVIEFGNPDPAISPFSAKPDKSKERPSSC